ncbi:transglycosylase domain-containing protein, partial [Devosia sp.]|uniref:transglycosylase domain-containing protein n=1 Tax=Devosia sp. TaxID=1871048 RepID=UPI002F1FE28F
GKAKRARGGRRRPPLTLGRLIGKLFYWLVVLGFWAGIAVAGVVVYFVMQMPAVDTWAVPERPPNIRILAANGQLLSNRGKTGGEAVALRELPYYVPAAVISIEDRRFNEHFGIDVLGLISVGLESLQAGEVTRGASTITQQLAKNLFLSPEQTLQRKVQEALLALWLEQNYSKEEILELYLNRVFFGNGATGIEAAAQRYFGKSARNLSLGEAAILAGSVQRPSRVNPISNPEAAAARARVVLAAMAKEGYISEAEAKAAAIDPNQRIRTKVTGSESYVADWVESLMTAYVGDVSEDVVVSTTIDWDLQKHAEFVVREAVANEGAARGFSQGALVAVDVDGTVRALVGGVDYAQSQFNRAVTSRRQPGSAFKPFVYLAAMEKGYTPDTVADDAPFEYNGWSPENASGKYLGPVTLRNALAYSLNTVSGRLAIDVGPDKVVEAAMRLGISSPMLPVPSIALGTSEVSLLELTAAYAPFANGGIGVIANVITRIETASGKLLYEAVPAGPGQVIQPEIVAEMNDMLTTALEIGTGKKAQLDGWPIAGKTGTSQKARDAVFVGYTARMVTGVWLGNDDDTGTKLSGGNVPVQIWSEFMSKAHAGMAVAELPGGVPAAPLDVALDPMEQPRQPKRTLVDLLGEIFGGQ